MAYKASHNFARIAASKVRPFATLIRGRQVSDGLNRLRFEPNRGARMLEKVLQSARANAEDQGARNVDKLTISDARVNEGPMLKRMMTRGRGMSYVIRRRFAHIIIELEAGVVA